MRVNNPLAQSNFFDTIEADHAVEMTEPVSMAEKTSTETSTKLSSEEFKTQLCDLFDSNQDFDSISHQAIDLIQQQNPELVQSLQDFCTTHPEKIAELQTKGWAGLKAEQGPKMKTDASNGMNYETFRTEAVAKVTNFCLAAVKEMGYHNPGEHSATGTPGYTSDIDTVYTASHGVPEKVQITEKLLFDATWNHIFGGRPGKQVDTESYLTHPGAAFNTDSKISSEQGRQGLSRMEANLATVQMFRAFKGDPKGWADYKNQQLDKAYSNEYRHALQEIFSETEVFQDQVHEEIKMQMVRESPDFPPGSAETMDSKELNAACEKILAKNPEAEKKAEMSYKAPRLLKISALMDEDKAQLASLQHKIEQETALCTRAGVPDSASLKQLKSTAEQTELRLATRGALRNCFFDETYLTQGAFNKTCLLEKGQMHQRVKETVQQQIARERYGLCNSNQPISLRLSAQQKTKASSQEALSSQQENLSMYEGHFKHQAEGGSLAAQQKAVCETSKYSERAAGAGVELVRAMKKIPGTTAKIKDFASFEKDVQTTHFKTSELEKCKRKKELNYTGTKQLLLETMIKPEMGPEEMQALITDIDELLKMSEPGGKFYDEESILPEDKLAVMLSFLGSKGHDTLPKNVSEGPHRYDPRLITILQARAGFPLFEQKNVQGKLVDVENSQLKAIHNEATAITLQAFGLTSETNIQQFNDQIQNLNTKIKNLAMQHGIVATPSCGNNANLSMLHLWQETEP